MEQKEGTPAASARVVSVDLVVALLIFLFGAAVVWGSYELGSSWDANGPQAGYFPFYIGLIICISSAVVFVQAALRFRSDARTFVTYYQLGQVLIILVPAFAYVAGIQLIGFYVPSVLFIGLFMKFVGKYSWLRSASVGVAVGVIAFVLFEIWFKIPLPKGPVESLLGF